MFIKIGVCSMRKIVRAHGRRNGIACWVPVMLDFGVEMEPQINPQPSLLTIQFGRAREHLEKSETTERAKIVITRKLSLHSSEGRDL